MGLNMKNSMSKTSILAVTAGAAASVGAGAALADSSMIPVHDDSFYLSLEGGALFADPAVDKLGSFSGSGFTVDADSPDTSLGYRGAAAFGQQLGSGWDWRVGVAYSNFLKDRSSLLIISSGGSGSGLSGSTAADLSYLTGDLELGLNIDPGSAFDLRLFAGLRALNSKDSLDKFGIEASGGYVASGVTSDHREFLGIGPRAGFDFSTRMGDGMLGLSGMAAGSVIFGRLDQEENVLVAVIDGASGGAITFTDSDTGSETLYNLEAALGLDLHVTERSTLTIGYRGEYWDNIRGEDKTGADDPDDFNYDGDLLSHGPFAKFKVNF